MHNYIVTAHQWQWAASFCEEFSFIWSYVLFMNILSWVYNIAHLWIIHK